MIVVKNINNNVSLCLDSQNNEVVVFGKGVGFCKPPYDIPLDRIEKTFYNVSEDMVDRLNTIRPDVIEAASAIVDLANDKLGNQFGSNVVFTLADHIQFAITRDEKNMFLSLPLLSEVLQNYPDECYIGQKALDIIREKLNVKLASQEASAIALHLVNYESQIPKEKEDENGELTSKCIAILEQELSVTINKNHFNYHRFVTHMYYLFKRVRTDCMFDSDNRILYQTLQHDFPDIARCAEKMRKLIESEYKKPISDEEVVYMMLHINRVCDREDCDH